MAINLGNCDPDLQDRLASHLVPLNKRDLLVKFGDSSKGLQNRIYYDNMIVIEGKIKRENRI